MLRRDIQDKKSETPEITGEYLKDVIDAYHAEKIKDGFLGREGFASGTMRELERFYQALPMKAGVLKKEEIYALCKIIFSIEKKGPKTKHLIDTLLLAYFDPNIVAIFDSIVARSGRLNLENAVFEKIFINPLEASAIVEQTFVKGKSQIQRETKDGMPSISGQFLKNLIEDYHIEKMEDNCFGMEFFVSPTMRDLDRFYYLELGKKTESLTKAEIFSLCKIIFSDKQLSPKTKNIIDNLFYNCFDPAVVSALHSAVTRAGTLDIFENYLDIIFKNPMMAATIVDAVLLLDHVVNHKLVTKAERPKLYSQRLLNEIVTHPELAVDIVTLHRIANDPETGLEKPKAYTFNTLDVLFRKDAIFFIALKLFQTQKFDKEKLLETIISLQDCSKIAIRAVAEQVAMNPDPYEPVDLYLSRRSLPLCAIFSTSKTMEERRLEYVKAAEEKLEEKSNKKEEEIEPSSPKRALSFSSIEV